MVNPHLGLGWVSPKRNLFWRVGYVKTVIIVVIEVLLNPPKPCSSFSWVRIHVSNMPFGLFLDRYLILLILIFTNEHLCIFFMKIPKMVLFFFSRNVFKYTARNIPNKSLAFCLGTLYKSLLQYIFRIWFSKFFPHTVFFILIIKTRPFTYALIHCQNYSSTIQLARQTQWPSKDISLIKNLCFVVSWFCSPSVMQESHIW